jgi:hypothetical protein
MTIDDPSFVPFLLRAKKNTYAAGDGGKVASTRPASHDLSYQEEDWAYLDTYLGGFAFIGEEAVWWGGKPIWGMNYYGTMTVDTIPDGFSPFLKQALLRVPAEAPYRGPAVYAEGDFTYTCRWEGALAGFRGEETIALAGQVVYRLDFHGGVIIE